MSLSFSYSARQVLARPLTSALTAGGTALVIVVFTATLMLARGLEQTLQGTGRADNLIAIRNGAQNEIQSGITRDQAAVIAASPGVAQTEAGVPILTKDLVVLLALTKKATGDRANVNVRGVGSAAWQVRNDL